MSMAAHARRDNMSHDHDVDMNRPGQAPPPADTSYLTVGRMVFVERRMGPGMNNPGGLGHVERVYPGGSAAVTHVDVRYTVEQTRDRGVPVAYVEDRGALERQWRSAAPGARARPRRSAGGLRCAVCRSFVTDCGDCAWIEAQRREERAAAAAERGGEGSDGGEGSCAASNAGADSEEDERRAVREAGRVRRLQGRVFRSERDQDDVPLAVLKREQERKEARRQKRQRARAREARRAAEKAKEDRESKMEDFRRMLAGREGAPPAPAGSKGSEEERKKKRKKSRTRPEKACSLGSLPPASATGSKGESGDGSSNNDKVHDQVCGRVQPADREQQENDETLFDVDSDNDGPPEAKQPKERRDQGVDGCYDNNEGHSDEQGGGDDDSGDDSSSDEDDLALSALAKHSKPILENGKSSERRRVPASRCGSQSNNVKLRGFDSGSEASAWEDMDHGSGESGDEEQEDPSLLTPREGYMEEGSSEDSHSSDDAHSGGEGDEPGEGSESDADVSGEATEGAAADSRASAVRWADLPAFIRELCADVKGPRTEHARKWLSGLNRRFLAVKKNQMAPKDRLAELERLSGESADLHEYIVKQLHRNGVDQCNEALTRLLNKKQRQKHEAKMTMQQVKECRETKVHLLEYSVDNVIEQHVKVIDRRTTSFQKDVANELRSAMAEEEEDYTDGALRLTAQQNRQKKRSSIERAWDPHQHASRKRKALSEQSSRSNRSNQNRNPSSVEASGKRKTTDWNARQHMLSQTESTSSEDGENALSAGNDLDETNPKFEDTDLTGERDFPDDENRHSDYENSNYGAARRSRQSTSNDFTASWGAPISELVNVDFTGETDEVDDDRHGSVLPLGIRAASGRKRTSHSGDLASFRVASREGHRRSSEPQQAQPLSKCTRKRLNKQSAENTETDGHWEGATANRRMSRRRNSARETSGTRESAPKSKRSRKPSSRDTGRESIGIRQKNNGDDGGSGSGGGRPSQKRSTNESLTRPATPNALCAEDLFDLLSTRSDISDVEDEECDISSNHGKTLGELCQMLKDVSIIPSDPIQMQDCHRILELVTSSILTRGDEEPRKEDIVNVMQALLSLFERKCTTLLDMLQAQSEDAYFQIDCWCLVFRILEKRWNERLCPENGNIYNIFGNRNSTLLVSHIILQIIDALYSQLLWEEYGATPVFHAQAFDKLRALCVRIGKVMPLLPLVCAQMKKIGSPKWRVSLINDQKENDPTEDYYLSAIDPLMHRRFIISGEPLPKSDQSRLKIFKRSLPRREIEAAWSIVGFFSCCASLTMLSAPNFKTPQELLISLLHYKCGTLPNGDHQLPPSTLQVDTCSKEIKWTCVLLSSRLLGDLPDMDPVVEQIVEKAVMLEAFESVLNILPSSVAKVKNKKASKQLWRYSCLACSPVESAELETGLHAGLMDVFSLDQSKNNVCCVLPSTMLLRRCVSLVVRYAVIVMAKKPRWKRFRAILLSLASKFDKRASEIESKTENKKNEGSPNNVDAFTEMFRSIETATKPPIVHLPTSSHLREAACHVMLAGVVARSRQNAPGEGNQFTLNKAFREKICKYSSDEEMRQHQPGNDAASSRNLCLQYTAAKTMTYTALLHLFVQNFRVEPIQIIESLCNHLQAVKLDDDANMIEYLVARIVSTLIASCGIMDNLNEQSHVVEQEEKCTIHLASSRSCVNVIRCISMWLNLIFCRAKFIVGLIPNPTPSDPRLMQILEAINQVGTSRFFLFVMKSLTRALDVITETTSRNTFSRALSRDGSLDAAFHSCLGAIRSSIALAHACRSNTAHVTQSAQSKIEWESGVQTYISLLKTKIFPSIFDTHTNPERQLSSQSGGVLSVLAALCSISSSQGAVCNVYSLFEPNLGQDGGGDRRFYFQQMGIMFSCELSRLANCPLTNCKAVAMQKVGIIFEHLLCSLLDADTLWEFSNCNLSSLSQLDDPNSLSKGENVPTKFQVHSITLENPDQEAHKIKRRSGDAFDTAGPNYNSNNIWSFCENVGHLLQRFNSTTRLSYQIWPQIRSLGEKMLDICKNLRSKKELLDMLPSVSVEQEIIKRLFLFQAIFAVLRRDSNQCICDLILGRGRSFPLVISKFIMENLYYLSGVEVEIEEQQRFIDSDDAATRYNRAETLTFLNVYAELCCSLLAMLFRESIPWENPSTRDMVLNQFIASVFKETLDIRRTIEKAAADFNVCLRKKSVSMGSKFRSHLTCYLFQSFSRRIGELLLVCDSDRGLNNYETALFSSMLYGASSHSSCTAASLEALIEAITNRLVLTPEAVGIYSTAASEGLQHAVDDCILRDEVLRQDKPSEQCSILRLREWVMGTLFIHLQKSRCTLQPLKLLSSMMKTYSSTVINRSHKIHSEGNLASIATFTKLFHSLKECLCNSVRSNSHDAMLELFTCASYCLTLPMSSNNVTNEFTSETLLSFAFSLTRGNAHLDASSVNVNLSYIVEVSKWLGLCGKLLTSQSSRSLFFCFIKRIASITGPETYALKGECKIPEFECLCLSFESLNELEKKLSIAKKKTTDQATNPYAQKPQSNSICEDACQMPSESLAAIDNYISTLEKDLTRQEQGN